MVPAPMNGRWMSEDGNVGMEFTEGGIFVTEVKGGPTLVGRCSFVGMRITMRFQLGSAICPEEPGQYTIELVGDSMRALDPGDTCSDRLKWMAQNWHRVALVPESSSTP